jgi:hypothetical protein
MDWMEEKLVASSKTEASADGTQRVFVKTGPDI